jgi:hypothetical protein
MEKIRFTFYALLVLVGIAALAFFANGLDLGLSSYFAPRQEQVRRNTFEQSQAYNEGMRRDLENIRNQYLTANDPAVKAALADTFRHRAEGYPNQLPPSLQQFYNSIN